MSSAVFQLIIMGVIAVVLFLRLRNVLGTRDGFEPKADTKSATKGLPRGFEVIEGGPDRDIADHVDIASDAGKAFAAMKAVEPDFSVTEFQGGARQAYEMILMAFEGGDLDTLDNFLLPEVYETFETVINERREKGLTVDAQFVGVSEMKIINATFDPVSKEAEVTLRFVTELTSVVRNAEGDIVEGEPNKIKRQTDIWTFARKMGQDNPNWELVATGG
jgi:predicted lipid-binding transport protein (Tim44 family)